MIPGNFSILCSTTCWLCCFVLLICFWTLCLRKEILPLLAYLYIIPRSRLSFYWSLGFVLVIIMPAWLLSKITCWYEPRWRYLFFGPFPLDLVFVNAKDLVFRPSTFSALCDNLQGGVTGLVWKLPSYQLLKPPLSWSCLQLKSWIPCLKMLFSVLKYLKILKTVWNVFL